MAELVRHKRGGIYFEDFQVGAVIEHGCRIGDFSRISAGSTIASEVTLAEGATTGPGSTIVTGTRLGAWSVVAAGGVVVRDLPDGALAKGVPARITRVYPPDRVASQP